MSKHAHNGVARRPYVRPMAGWWRRDPFFVRYMVREATALIVALYAIVLLVGVLRLSQGEAAWNGWLAALRSPWSVLFHLVMLVAMIYHTVSWFEIMPKTMPMLIVGGKRVAAQTITRTGLAVAVLAALALFALVWGLAP
ncbi:fumarate reductase subunit C [Piscinibacter sp.]|jgi:fumarate reductase subunit C|uniref:fumarate reductase subunit C n=1 Tax=Piscinibacter sp. TaxID=1903157 RepID=UPI00355A6A9B